MTSGCVLIFFCVLEKVGGPKSTIMLFGVVGGRGPNAKCFSCLDDR